MSEFNDDGLIVDTLSEVVAKLERAFKDSYGEDFKTEVESPAGQIIKNISGIVGEQNEMIESVANIFNPQSIGGFFQSMLVAINGIQRKKPAFSTVALEVEAGTEPTTILKGSIVTEQNEVNDWVLDADVALLPFEKKVTTATCSKAGAVEANPDDITKIKTPIYSWETVRNISSAVVGNVEESDFNLRIRRNQASKQKGQCSEKSVFIEVSNIESVESVSVNVNPNETTDANGIPPQHYFVIIKGGTDEEIGNAFIDSIGGGIGMIGDISLHHYDAETDRYYDDFKYSRQSDINTYIKMNIAKGENFPVDGEAQIKQNLIDLYAGTFQTFEGFGIGKPVIYSHLYSAINAVEDCSVNSLFLGLNASPTGQANLPMGIDEQGFIDEAQIEITGV